jgi:hypothetical protein
MPVQIWDSAKVTVIRRTLKEIADQGELDASGHMRCAFLQCLHLYNGVCEDNERVSMVMCRIGGMVVSVFYLRAGYAPTDYTGDVEWQGREAMESCSAVSCPSVAYQLVGAKKIQQDLAAPGTALLCSLLGSFFLLCSGPTCR